MKQVMFLVLCFCLVGIVQAEITITNGDFETNAPASNTYDVDSWFDSYPTVDGQTNNWWWEATWYGPTVSPTGTSVMGLSYMFTTTNWAYQSVGVNDTALSQILIGYDVGSFTDAGGARDLGVTVEMYQSDGTFVGADQVDIAGAAGVTLIDSFSLTSGSLLAGEVVHRAGIIDLTTANTTDELFLRISNFATATGEPWAAIDNIVPEPATMLLLGLGGVLLRRKR